MVTAAEQKLTKTMEHGLRCFYEEAGQRLTSGFIYPFIPFVTIGTVRALVRRGLLRHQEPFIYMTEQGFAKADTLPRATNLQYYCGIKPDPRLDG